jgi:AraC family transcriptional regulator
MLPSDESPVASSPSTLGESRRVVCTDRFVVRMTNHAPDTRLPPHFHERATMMAVLGGDYEERIGRDAYLLPPLGVAIKPAGQLHQNRVGPRGARSLVVELCAQPGADTSALEDVMGRAPARDVTPASETILQLVAEMLRPTSVSPLAIDGLVLEWVGLLAAADGQKLHQHSPPPWLLRVRDRLHHAHEDPPSMTTLAREAGRHPVYVARAFRRHYGTSIGVYARRIRIGRAARQLADAPRASISRIALDCGYHDHSHLAHELRARAGMCPGEWRGVAAG